VSVRIEGSVIYLSGRCPADDAEPLLVALQEQADCTVDLSGAQRLHTAVAQILFALKPPLLGRPSDSFQRRYLFPETSSTITTAGQKSSS
jgi:hypothetical protein